MEEEIKAIRSINNMLLKLPADSQERVLQFILSGRKPRVENREVKPHNPVEETK